MSEISVISNQYNKMVVTSDQVNNSVIAFKKKKLLSQQKGRSAYPQITLEKDEEENAREILIEFLKNVRGIIKGEETRSEYIPSLIVKDYKSKLSGSVYVEEDVDSLLTKLEKHSDLGDESITVLDSLLLLLDKERNALFRKLRRARG